MGIMMSLGARKTVYNQAGQPSQLQRIAKLLKFCVLQVFKLAETFHNIIFQGMIILYGCAGWSELLLFTPFLMALPILYNWP